MIGGPSQWCSGALCSGLNPGLPESQTVSLACLVSSPDLGTFGQGRWQGLRLCLAMLIGLFLAQRLGMGDLSQWSLGGSMLGIESGSPACKSVIHFHLYGPGGWMTLTDCKKILKNCVIREHHGYDFPCTSLNTPH